MMTYVRMPGWRAVMWMLSLQNQLCHMSQYKYNCINKSQHRIGIGYFTVTVFDSNC